MSVPVKTIVTPELIPLVAINAGVGAYPIIGSRTGCELNTSTKFAGGYFWDFAPIATTAAASATLLSIQGSFMTSGDTAWMPIQEWQSPVTVPNNPTLTGTAGSNAATVSNATGIASGQDIFIYNAGNIALSEFARIVAISGTNLTLEDNLSFNQVATPMFNYCQRLKLDIDFSIIKRVRVLIYNARGATNRNVVCRVAGITFDSVV